MAESEPAAHFSPWAGLNAIASNDRIITADITELLKINILA